MTPLRWSWPTRTRAPIVRFRWSWATHTRAPVARSSWSWATPTRAPIARPASICAALLAVSLALAACAPLEPSVPGSGSAPDHAARTATATGTRGAASTAHDEHPGVHGIPATAAPGWAAAGSPVAIAQATHEYPSAPVAQSVSATATSPIAAVQAFAHAYINWSASTVAADMRALAAQSVGQARSAMQLAAAQTGRDYELQRGGVANQGSVEAIAPLAGTGEQYAVVTLERTTATATDAYQGLQPEWHVAVAAVTQVAAGRWAVSDWQPES